MSEKKNKQSTAAPSPEKQVPGKVIELSANKCLAESCKSKPSRAGFCEEHYLWFKEGLLTMDGYKAKDFDKKYHNYMKHQQKKVA